MPSSQTMSEQASSPAGWPVKAQGQITEEKSTAWTCSIVIRGGNEIKVKEMVWLRAAAEPAFTQGPFTWGSVFHGQSDARFPEETIQRTGVGSLSRHIWARICW